MAYKAIHDTFWTDPDTKNLKPNDKLVFLYLITNSHTHYSGIYYLPKVLIKIETKIPDKTVEKCIAALSEMNFVA